MAKNNLSNYKDADGLGFPLNFRRGNPNPLDNSSVWKTYAEAKTYAETSAVSYVGQILSVLSDDGLSVTIYSIQNEAGLLKEVGTVPVGDDKSITVVDGIIKILGVDEAEAGAQLVKKADGTVEWVKPDTTTVDGLSTAVKGLQENVKTLTDDKANKADVYTKAEIDSKVASVYKYIGSVKTYAELPTEDLVIGYVYNVETADKKNGIKAGDNVAWNGTSWDNLGGNVDLSAYSTTEQIDTKLDTKVDKVDGSRLMTDAEGTKLEGIESGAQLNKIESVDTTQLSIDETKKLSITAVDKSKVTGLQDALDGKVDAEEGKSLSTNDFTNAYKAKLDKVNENADVNTIEIVKINGEAQEIDGDDKSVDIPLATAAHLGLVKSSTAENNVSVDTNGVMSVNSLNVNKLVQTEGDTLILDGGSF